MMTGRSAFIVCGKRDGCRIARPGRRMASPDSRARTALALRTVLSVLGSEKFHQVYLVRPEVLCKNTVSTFKKDTS